LVWLLLQYGIGWLYCLGFIPVSLASYKSITEWNPKIADFIIWHGWIRHWYGVVNAITDDLVTVIKDGLPCLLFTMDCDQYKNNSINISINKIRNSSGGEFHVLQDKVWFL
jgi:hypothetical protein